MKTDIYNQDGKKKDSIELNDAIFGLPWNSDLVHQIATAMTANARIPWAHAKNRGEVAGTGKKPWAQKGTGQARHGSRRSPIWVGGGVSHGPRNDRDYSQKINKKMKKKAFFTVLSRKLKDGEILFLDKVILMGAKTKEAVEIMKSISGIKGFEKMDGKKKNKAVLSLAKKDSDTEKSFRNIPGMLVSESRNLNLLDLLTFKYLIIANPEESLKIWDK